MKASTNGDTETHMTDADHEARIADAHTKVLLTERTLDPDSTECPAAASALHNAAIDAYHAALEAYINHLRGKPSK